MNIISSPWDDSRRKLKFTDCQSDALVQWFATFFDAMDLFKDFAKAMDPNSITSFMVRKIF